MTDGRLHLLQGNQAAASDPQRNVWLSASAGTGKTQVLAARVWRLLLAGVDPSAILCLTFTKAGAAEMAERITGRLARWVRAPRDEVRRDLEALGEDWSLDAIARARTLFARLLDAPGGGIRIQTIHSFCQSLLAAFPMEAGLVPGFRPLDAREEAVLARETLAAMLEAAERSGQDALVDAIGALSLRLGEGRAEAFLLECARAGDALEAIPEAVQPWLRDRMGLPQGDIAQAIAKGCAEIDEAALRRVIAANREWGAAKGIGHAETVERWLAGDRAALLDELILVFRTDKGAPRKISSKLAALEPQYEALCEMLGDACGALIAMRGGAAYADLLAAGLAAGRDYARAWREAKRRAGVVDFDDLIRATVGLLQKPGMGEWVRFKLDQTTEHVLIDEAQDTNLAQWTIVRAIADEFFAGEGAHASASRTLFTVGDYKQAIFGFQGTDPVFFRAAYEHFRARSLVRPEFDAEVRAVELLSLTHSFRSTPPVLEFVDAALARLPEPGLGVLTDLEPHESAPGPGTVTLWEPEVDGGTDADEEGWVGDSTRSLARRIARTIKGWIGTLPLESKGRMLEPGDVMILVKRRGELASLIVARLYAEGVAVAGVDRLRLNSPLAVQDLLAAIRFALQPDDDLSLASLLVSPLIGWSQEDLMAAAPRPRGSLWRHLRATQPPERIAPLEAMLARADFTTPYRFLEELLSGPTDGRRQLLRRLGEEARDPIEELLNAARSFERMSAPSLQRFLDWFDRGDVEIKREPETGRRAVRVMTAHGAKGLQAPLVILADSCIDPTRSPRDFLRWTPAEHGGGPLPVFRPRVGERMPALAAAIDAANQRELEEHWRLFYVAATRAEERLVIAGALGPLAKGVPAPQSWYAAAARAFDALGVPGGGVRIFRGTAPAAPAPPAAVAQIVATGDLPAVPGWARSAAPEEPRPPRPLAPSAIGDDSVADPPPDPALRAAAERGRLLHALFERLPGVAASSRAQMADAWLRRSAGVSDPSLRAEIAGSALRVLDDPRFAELFGTDSLAEAPIAAVVGSQVVSGTVDRLVVAPDRVRVIDFKTGRRAPATIADIPPYHLRQMAAYAEALAVIFPQRAVEVGLLYTAAPVLYLLPPDLLAAHKPGFAGEEQSLPLRA